MSLCPYDNGVRAREEYAEQLARRSMEVEAQIQKRIDDAIAREREECARICDGYGTYPAHEAAGDIRARGERK